MAEPEKVLSNQQTLDPNLTSPENIAEKLVQPDKIFEFIVEENEVSWQSIIMELVKENKMDPWDIDVGLLSQKYIALIKHLKETDFRISGKVLLAAAVLLRIKTNRLVTDDITELDRLISSTEELDEDAFYEELEQDLVARELTEEEKMNLIPRTPQPRKRKVSIYDLMSALEQALEVKRRRVLASMPDQKVTIPDKKYDISNLIKNVYSKIVNFFAVKSSSTLMFSHLIPSEEKKDKIMTFIPLLHLSNHRRIDLIQDEPFADFEVSLLKNKANKALDKELGLIKQ